MTLPEYERLAQLNNTGHASAATHLPLIEDAEATGEVAELYQHFRAHFARPDVPGILKCFASHPPLLRHMMELSKSLIFADGELTRRQKEMIATLVSSQNGCAYCADSHGYFLRMHGGSAEVLAAVQQGNLDSPAFSSAEHALLAFVAKVNSRSQAIVADDMTYLRSSGWNDPQIAEAIHIAALFATYNRVANAFGLASQGLLALYENESTEKSQ